MKSINAIFTAFFFLLFLQALPAFAAQTAGGTPTTVTSQRMEYNTNASTVVFIGSVHVVRPDMEIWSERLTLVLKKEQAGDAAPTAAGQAGLAGGDIEKLIAEKNVRMKREDRHGECEKATYTAADELLVMEGDPKLFEGENSITGTKILFYMKENRSEVIGAPDKPVRVIFTSNGQPDKPAGSSQQPGANRQPQTSTSAPSQGPDLDLD